MRHDLWTIFFLKLKDLETFRTHIPHHIYMCVFAHKGQK